MILDGHPWSRRDLYDIGALIEQPPVYPNLTARQNLKVRTTLFGLPDERIDQALSIAGLSDTGSKKTGQFSLGMKQRLGIANAILAKPTNGLDPLGIEELRGMIRRFPQQGMSVIVSSHILSEVSMLADHIGITPTVAWPTRISCMPGRTWKGYSWMCSGGRDEQPEC